MPRLDTSRDYQAEDVGAALTATADEMPLSWTVPSYPEWREQVDMTQEWMITDLVPAQSLLLVSGTQKIGHKTTWVTHLAIALAMGKSYDIIKLVDERPRSVLFVEQEGAPAQTAIQIDKIAMGMGYDPRELKNLYFAHHAYVQLDHPGWVERVLDVCHHRRVEFVVFDPFCSLFTGDENKMSDVKPPLDSIDKIRTNAKATVTYIHHQGKGAVPYKGKVPDMDQSSRGSGHITAVYDMHHSMSRREGDSSVYMKTRYRGAGDAEYQICYTHREDGTRMQVKRTDDVSVLSDAQRKLSEYIEPGKQYSKSELALKAGIKGPQLGKVLDQMIEGKELSKAGTKYVALKGD